MNIIYDPIKEFIRLVLGLNEHQPITWVQKIFVFGCVIFLILILVIVGSIFIEEKFWSLCDDEICPNLFGIALAVDDRIQDQEVGSPPFLFDSYLHTLWKIELLHTVVL